MVVSILGPAIGEAILAGEVDATKLAALNQYLGEHYVIKERLNGALWHWTTWCCPNNPDFWLNIGVRRRCSSAARAAGVYP